MRGALGLAIALGLAACGRGKSGAPATLAPGDSGSDSSARDDAAPSGGVELSFAASDGATITGTYWAPGDATTTGCAIFVHQLSSTRAEWAPVVERLRGHGHLYAIDLRGHGASAQGPKGWQSFELADWQAVEGDVLGAVDAMVAKGAHADCVLVGASIGSTAVLLAAAHAPTPTRGVVLLSPGLAYKGIATPDAARAVKAPVLLVHSQEKGAVDAAGALAGIWRDAGVPVEVIADPGTAHGMKIVAGDRATLDQVVAFIDALIAR